MNITSGKQKKAQKIVVYGPEGIGKSTFASKFPNPIFTDTEGSTAQLDVKRFDKPTSWAMLMAQIDYVLKNKPSSTYVIDTADWAEKLAKEYIISNAPSQQIKSIEDFGYGKGYTMLAEEWGRFLNKLQDVVDAGINVVILAHAMMRKFEQPSETGAYDRWELKLEKKTAPITKEWADAVLFATYEIYVVNVDGQGASKGKNKAQGGSRVMYTTHNPAWDAKNRWGLVDKLPFDFISINNHVIDMNKEIPISSQSLEKSTVSQKDKVEKVEEESSNTTESKKESKSVTNDDFSFFLKPLQDLLEANLVTRLDLNNYMFNKGHFPVNTPLEKVPENYQQGLIANWEKVLEAINDSRTPF